MLASDDTAARLQGLLDATRLSGGSDDPAAVLRTLARTVAETLAFGGVAVNVRRLAWDDFEVAAAHGDPELVDALLGTTSGRDEWEGFLAARHERRGTYLVPHSAPVWRTTPKAFLRDGPAPATEDAWHPGDGLFVPMRDADGELLGIISVDEPASGRRPMDEELDLLVAAAEHGARAIENAQRGAQARRHRQVLEQLLRVSTELTSPQPEAELLQTVCDAISEVLGFGLVVVELADRERDRYRPVAATGIDLASQDLQLDRSTAQIDAFFQPRFEQEGCYLAARAEALEIVGASPTGFASLQNGRGEHAWQRHWLIVPIDAPDGERAGFIWVDEPADRLIPSRERLQALRLFANQAAGALSARAGYEALHRASEQRRALIDDSPLAIVTFDAEGLVQSWNPAATAIFGWEEHEVLGRPAPYVPPESAPEVEELWSLVRRGKSVVGLERTRVRRDGSAIDLGVSAAPLHDRDGRVVGAVCTLADVTAANRTHRDLGRRNAELEALHTTTLELLDRLDPSAVLNTILHRATELLDAEDAYLYLVDEEGLRLEAGAGVFAGSLGARMPAGAGLAGRVWAEGRALAVEDYTLWSGRDQRYEAHGFRAIGGVPLRAGSEVVGVLGVAYRAEGRLFGPAELALLGRFGQLASLALENARLYDSAQRELAERTQAEEALRKSQELYRKVVETSSDAITLMDLEGTVVFASPAVVDVLGVPVDALVGRRWATLVHPDDVEHAREVLERSLAGERGLVSEARVRHDDGTWRVLEGTATAILGEDGLPELVVMITRDVTDRRREEGERHRLQEQLRQSQKMEAIGQLAGGIAHDFNNLLTGISGYGELALARLPEGSPVRRHVEEMRRAGDRAAALTRQLLAFSRKQVLQPRVLDLNEIVSDFGGMLGRLLGENVELRLDLHPDLGHARADPGQLEQVLMNLAINARDAMPAGGTLVLRTENATLDEGFVARHNGAVAGEYVLLAVSDVGTGMDRETLERVFEPFFTTKEPGRGTGLGLATVYGIVKQSGGQIWAYSEPGRGTTFKVYLPRVWAAAPARELPGPATPLTGTETVLLVEDEELVRRLAREVLEACGFLVLEASGPLEALDRAAAHRGEIDVLLTDVVMPDLSGQALAELLVASRPGLKVLFTSGYTEEAIASHGVLSPGSEFLEKPFTAAELALKLRLLLDTAVAA